VESWSLYFQLASRHPRNYVDGSVSLCVCLSVRLSVRVALLSVTAVVPFLCLCPPASLYTALFIRLSASRVTVFFFNAPNLVITLEPVMLQIAAGHIPSRFTYNAEPCRESLGGQLPSYVVYNISYLRIRLDSMGIFTIDAVKRYFY